jgi:hypothetical protein
MKEYLQCLTQVTGALESQRTVEVGEAVKLFRHNLPPISCGSEACPPHMFSAACSVCRTLSSSPNMLLIGTNIWLVTSSSGTSKVYLGQNHRTENMHKSAFFKRNPIIRYCNQMKADQLEGMRLVLVVQTRNAVHVACTPLDEHVNNDKENAPMCGKGLQMNSSTCSSAKEEQHVWMNGQARWHDDKIMQLELKWVLRFMPY